MPPTLRLLAGTGIAALAVFGLGHQQRENAVDAAAASASAGAQGALAIDPSPVLDIPGTAPGGALMFGVATWATRLPSGAIAVADGSEPELRLFDAKGALVGVIGRAGSGPGEFRALTWVGHCGTDSLFAWDFPQLRMTVFDSRGTVARSFKPAATSLTAVASCSETAAFALLSTPRLVQSAAPPRAADAGDPMLAPPRVLPTTATLSLFDRTGSLTATIGEFSAGERISGNLSGRSMSNFRRPLGADMHFALAGDRVYVGLTDSSSLLTYSSTGQRAVSMPLGLPGSGSPSRAQYERATELVVSTSPAQLRETTQASILKVPMPDRLPAYSAILTDPARMVWLVLSVPGDADTRLRVLRPDGRPAADLRLPVSMSIFEVGSDYILGVRDEGSGEQHVVVYRLRRGA